jgi:hypothetical protein
MSPTKAHARRSRAPDRLGRSLGELLATVEKLRSRRIALLSLEEKSDTNSAGIAAARARGKRPGRQPLDADKIAAALEACAGWLVTDRCSQAARLGRWNVARSAAPVSNVP